MANLFTSVRSAIRNLNPQEIRDLAARPVRIGLHAVSEASFAEMERFFALESATGASSAVVKRAIGTEHYDIEIYSQELARPADGFLWSPVSGDRTVREILAKRPELVLPLASSIAPFRCAAVRRVVTKIAKENALFSLATALPDIIPLLSLPWAVGEFASDTAVLTANQIRMVFLVAAAHGRDIGYREQKREIATIVLGAFGWRAIARELVSKIPFGGGLLPKAAIAYAGTQVTGMSIDRIYRFGRDFTDTERRAAYERALERGRAIAGSVLASIRHLQAGAPRPT